MTAEAVAARLARFTARFGEAHRLLVRYAALPMILTPELLNYLRNHFLRDRVPLWVSEVDLLLSELCRPVGYEQFALDPAVRAELLKELRDQEGTESMAAVARLLIRYVQQLSRSAPALNQDAMQAEQWSAMVFMEEQRETAVREIATAFRDRLAPVSGSAASVVKAVPQAELTRLVRLTGQLSEQLHDYPELVRWAEEVGRLLASPDGLARLTDGGRHGGATLTFAGVELPKPVAGREHVIDLIQNVHRLEQAYRHVSDPAERARLQESIRKLEDRIRHFDDRSKSVERAASSPSAPTPFRDKFHKPLQDGSTEGPEMVWLPGGSFLMGSLEGDYSERPQHEVTLSHYAVGKYPVTVGEFRRFVEATGYRTEAETGDGSNVWNRDIDGWNKINDASWRKPYFKQGDNNPVVCISWNDAKAYCEWLSKETGQHYGLLTEAQWEYACRAGSQTKYCFGDDEEKLGEYAWYSRNAGDGTHPVGEKAANVWGLHDPHGNVWEWCEDWFGDYSLQPQQDPGGPEAGSDRVIRGGSWNAGAGYCRSAIRNRDEPSYRSYYLGFRLSRTGPLPSYPFTLGQPEPEPPPIPAFIENLRDTLKDESEGPAMVWLPGGEFTMGQEESPYDREKPAHLIRLAAYSIGQYPVTCDEYDRFCQETDRKLPDAQGSGRGKRPVVNVGWEDALAYCAWLSQQTGERYRLPTEAEWEFACRAGSATRYCFGDDEAVLKEHGWYSGNSVGQTHPVGKRKANAWQIHDMHGNVWEWCSDWYAKDFYKQFASRLLQAESAGERAVGGETQAAGNVTSDAGGAQRLTSDNPTGPEDGSFKVVRGGSWDNDADYCRSAYRYGLVPTASSFDLGFRLARSGSWRSHPVTLGAAQPPEPPSGPEAQPPAVGRQPFAADQDAVGMGMPTYPQSRSGFATPSAKSAGHADAQVVKDEAANLDTPGSVSIVPIAQSRDRGKDVGRPQSAESESGSAHEKAQAAAQDSKEVETKFWVLPVNPPLSLRLSAVVSLEMVNVVEEYASEVNISPSWVELVSELFVKAWVRNIAYSKTVWIDLNLYDDERLIRTDPLQLHYLGPASGDGDFFAIKKQLHQVATAGPGWATSRPSRWHLQYRLYYEVNDQLFTDGIIHQPK